MLYLKDNGFVIRRINFSESDRFIILFTKNHGKIEVVGKGVRKITSRRAPLVELLNLVNFQAVKSSRNFILTEVELINSFQDNKRDLAAISISFFICELIDKLCAYNQKHEDVFELVINTIESLRKSSSDKLLYEFQTQLLSLLGFWDRKRQFRNREDLRNFIENIIERKIQTKIYV